MGGIGKHTFEDHEHRYLRYTKECDQLAALPERRKGSKPSQTFRKLVHNHTLAPWEQNLTKVALHAKAVKKTKEFNKKEFKLLKTNLQAIAASPEFEKRQYFAKRARTIEDTFEGRLIRAASPVFEKRHFVAKRERKKRGRPNSGLTVRNKATKIRLNLKSGFQAKRLRKRLAGKGGE